MKQIAAVFFDVDGVLVDSLEAHLDYCARKAREYKLQLPIPSPQAFKALVHAGAKVSPMAEFFRTLGFPEPLARRANEDYQREFPKLYALGPFAGVDRLLDELQAAGLPLGIVTSNTRANITAALGHCLRQFVAACVFTKDDPRNLSKEAALLKGADELGVDVSTILFVGDQLRDYEAAAAVGSPFLGVSYGWGIEKGDRQFPVVNSPVGTAEYVRGHSQSA